jgi:putative ABC transport system permease protein
VEGVAAAVGLLYATAGVDLGDTVVYSYLFAVDNDAPFGGPWALAEGRAAVGPREVVIDRVLGVRNGLGIGDTVSIMGNDLVIAGFSEESFGIATSLTWVNKPALARAIGVSPAAASYVLVQPEPGVDLEDVAAGLRAAVPEANLMTRDAFIASDKEMIRQMGADLIRIMSGVAYLVGLMVIGLTIYMATLERGREYGILKAVGARLSDLMRVVVAQAVVSSALGFAIGVVLSYSMAAFIGWLLPEMLVLIEVETLLRQVPVLAGVTLVAALLPLGLIARLDPIVVFKT